MWKGKSVSIIFPTFNEKDSIKAAIEDFFASGYVDEVIVINNNAAMTAIRPALCVHTSPVFPYL